MRRFRKAWYALVSRAGFFRCLFLIRKTFLIKFWNVHFSQWGEDVVVELFTAKAPPNARHYIDVGCFHPKKHSNTYLLHRKGWSGINIDVDRIKLEVFRLARPDDENICCAVGSAAGSATLYSFGYYSLINTLDRDKAEQYVREGHACEQQPVQVRTLTDIIESSRFKGGQFGLLNIDVEGFEEAVLRSLDFSKYRPAVILVEFHLVSLDALEKDSRYRLLTEERNYVLVNWTGITVVFMDRTLL